MNKKEQKFLNLLKKYDVFIKYDLSGFSILEPNYTFHGQEMIIEYENNGVLRVSNDKCWQKIKSKNDNFHEFQLFVKKIAWKYFNIQAIFPVLLNNKTFYLKK